MALGEMIPIFKNKGSSNDFSKYRMIGLIGHAMKLVSSVLLYYLLRETTDFLPESQSGFRKGRSTKDAGSFSGPQLPVISRVLRILTLYSK